MPFYLYGTHDEAKIDHILIRGPNTQLPASSVKFELGVTVPEKVLTKIAILWVMRIEAAAMQPFPSAEDNTLTR